MITKQFIIRGRVQGVGYRYFAKDSASKLGISGWVKNQIDGTVKILAQSEEGPLSLFEAYLNKGSVHSYIKDIEITILENIERYEEFKIIL